MIGAGGTCYAISSASQRVGRTSGPLSIFRATPRKSRTYDTKDRLARQLARLSTNVNFLGHRSSNALLRADGTVRLWEMAPWVSERRSPGTTTLSRRDRGVVHGHGSSDRSAALAGCQADPVPP